LSLPQSTELWGTLLEAEESLEDIRSHHRNHGN